MAERLTVTAEAIASALGTLPAVKEAYPYPQADVADADRRPHNVVGRCLTAHHRRSGCQPVGSVGNVTWRCGRRPAVI